VSTPVLRPRILVLLHLFLLSFAIVYVLCCVMLAVDKSLVNEYDDDDDDADDE